MEPNGRNKQQPAKPTQVTVAVFLIYAALVVTLLHALINPAAGEQAGPETAPHLLIYFAYALAFVFPIFLANNITAGRNWARQLYSVGVFLNFFYVAQLLQYFDDYPLVTTLGTIPFLFQIMAIVLLFQGPANAWFRASRTAAKSQSELNEKPKVNKQDQSPPEGLVSSEPGENKAGSRSPAKYGAFAAAMGAGISLTNALVWYSTLQPQADPGRQLVIFLILGVLALGAAGGGILGFVFLQFARKDPNRTPILWVSMGGILGGVFSFGCCFSITILTFV